MRRLAELFGLSDEVGVVARHLAIGPVVGPLGWLELDAVAQPAGKRARLAPLLERDGELVLQRAGPPLCLLEVLQRAVPGRFDLAVADVRVVLSIEAGPQARRPRLQLADRVDRGGPLLAEPTHAVAPVELAFFPAGGPRGSRGRGAGALSDGELAGGVLGEVGVVDHHAPRSGLPPPLALRGGD